MADRVWTDEQVNLFMEIAFESGRQFEARRISEAVAELDSAWVSLAKVSREQRIAERVRLFEDCARKLAEQLGRPPGYEYRGGPVRVWGYVPATGGWSR